MQGTARGTPHRVGPVEQDEDEVKAGQEGAPHAQILGDRLAPLVVSPRRIGRGQDARPRGQRDRELRLGDAHALLLHGLQQCPLGGGHLVQFVYAAAAWKQGVQFVGFVQASVVPPPVPWTSRSSACPQPRLGVVVPTEKSGPKTSQ